MNFRSQSGVFCENVLKKDAEIKNMDAKNTFLVRSVTIAYLDFYIVRQDPDIGLLFDPDYVFEDLWPLNYYTCESGHPKELSLSAGRIP